MVFSFVRHENDAEGREVVENRARVQGIQGRERFRSNDEDFSTGAMALRCEAARTPKMVMNRFGCMSARNRGETTMDRVLPFQNTRREWKRVKELFALEHRSRNDRTGIHGAASVSAAVSGVRQQRYGSRGPRQYAGKQITNAAD